MARFDPTTPSIARVYDYVLGGKDNFAADRELAGRLLALVPLIAKMAVENRQFLARAVTWAANQGVGQFIDLGCGLPTVPNTHESAQALIGDARVAYVDNDPVVVNHLKALLAKGNSGVWVVNGDVRDVAAILGGVRSGLDLSEPVCLVAGYLLHFFTADAARDLVATYAAALAPGSYLVLSVLHADGEAADEGLGAYSSEAAPVYSHSVPEIASFFGTLELVLPGVVDARQWHPGWEFPNLPPRDSQVVVGVARRQLCAVVTTDLGASVAGSGPTVCGQGRRMVTGYVALLGVAFGNAFRAALSRLGCWLWLTHYGRPGCVWLYAVIACPGMVPSLPI